MQLPRSKGYQINPSPSLAHSPRFLPSLMEFIIILELVHHFKCGRVDPWYLYIILNMAVWGILYDGVLYQSQCLHPSLGHNFFRVIFSKRLIWFKNEMALSSHVASFKKRSTSHLRLFVHTYLGHTTPRSLISQWTRSSTINTIEIGLHVGIGAFDSMSFPYSHTW